MKLTGELLEYLAKARAAGILVLRVSADGSFEAHMSPAPHGTGKPFEMPKPREVLGLDGKPLPEEEAQFERDLFPESSPS